MDLVEQVHILVTQISTILNQILAKLGYKFSLMMNCGRKTRILKVLLQNFPTTYGIAQNSIVFLNSSFA